MSHANDNTSRSLAEPAKTGRPCPICGKQALTAYRPFCSKRCADIDLNRWLGGVYAVPAAPDDEPDDDPGQQ